MKKSKRPTPRHIIIKLSKDKDKEDFESNKREANCHIQRIINKINSRTSLMAQWLRICLLMQGKRV